MRRAYARSLVGVLPSYEELFTLYVSLVLQ
jgi:hypothetical protein